MLCPCPEELFQKGSFNYSAVNTETKTLDMPPKNNNVGGTWEFLEKWTWEKMYKAWVRLNILK